MKIGKVDTQFRPWFAWYPVRVKGVIVWLEPVLRHRYYHWLSDSLKVTYVLPRGGGND